MRIFASFACAHERVHQPWPIFILHKFPAQIIMFKFENIARNNVGKNKTDKGKSVPNTSLEDENYDLKTTIIVQEGFESSSLELCYICNKLYIKHLSLQLTQNATCTNEITHAISHKINLAHLFCKNGDVSFLLCFFDKSACYKSFRKY